MCADFDGNGVVDEADQLYVRSRSGTAPATFADGDVTGDGVVNSGDAFVTRKQLGRICLLDPAAGS